MQDDLTKDYIATTVEEIENLEKDILELEQYGYNHDVLMRIRRVIHSVKGSAGSYGFPSSSFICHQIEDFLELIKEQKDLSELTSQLLKLNDLLRQSFYANPSQLNRIKSKIMGLCANESTTGAHALMVGFSRAFTGPIRTILSKHGIQSTVVLNEHEAMTLLINQHFDLIFTAFELPVITGDRLIMAHKALFPDASTTSFLITSHENIEEKPEYHIIQKNKSLLQEIERHVRFYTETIHNTYSIKHETASLSSLVHIDDDQSIRNLVSFALTQNSSLHIFHGETADDAITLCLKHKPDLLLLDYCIQDSNGSEVLNKIKQIKELSDMPVIFMTGEERLEKLDLLQKSGAAGIIRKPFRPVSLKKEILDILNKKVV